MASQSSQIGKSQVQCKTPPTNYIGEGLRKRSHMDIWPPSLHAQNCTCLKRPLSGSVPKYSIKEGTWFRNRDKHASAHAERGRGTTVEEPGMVVGRHVGIISESLCPGATECPGKAERGPALGLLSPCVPHF